MINNSTIRVADNYPPLLVLAHFPLDSDFATLLARPPLPLPKKSSGVVSMAFLLRGDSLVRDMVVLAFFTCGDAAMMSESESESSITFFGRLFFFSIIKSSLSSLSLAFGLVAKKFRISCGMYVNRQF